MNQILTDRLFALQDSDYKAFHSRLMPTVDSARIIGVRIPDLRKLAKEVKDNPETRTFLQDLPHTYYEEDNLHGFLIEQIKDYDACIEALNRFLPYVDNWATCDLVAPKVLGVHREELLGEIRAWLASDHTYTIRYGIGMLMRHYLGEAFLPEYPEMVAAVRSEEYYVNMMRAWYFATALARQYEAVLPYLQEQRLDVWTHNKTIQKAVESDRITPEQKTDLKRLRIKYMGKGVYK